MTDEAPPQPTPKRVNLARLAIVFAVFFGIAFGLCTVGAFIGSASQFLWPATLIVEGTCLLGLLVTGLWAALRSIRSNF